MHKIFLSLAAALAAEIGARAREALRRFQARIGRVPGNFAAAGRLNRLRTLG
jgi:transcriptional regulator GlxA family with amidase domain